MIVSREPVAAVEDRCTVRTFVPAALCELVDLVAGLLAEQFGEIPLIRTQQVHDEPLRVLRDTVRVVRFRDAHEPPRRIDAALRVEADEATGALAVVRCGHDDHRIVDGGDDRSERVVRHGTLRQPAGAPMGVVRTHTCMRPVSLGADCGASSVRRSSYPSFFGIAALRWFASSV